MPWAGCPVRLEPDPGLTVTCTHVDGHYSLDHEPEWEDPRTEILVDGHVKVRIVGDTFGLNVHWLENDRPIDDLTGCTPSYMDHYEAVRYWIESLDTRVPVHVAMQDAGLFPAGEFVDAEPGCLVEEFGNGRSSSTVPNGSRMTPLFC